MGFPEMGVPLNHPFNWDFLIKTIHLGVPPWRAGTPHIIPYHPKIVPMSFWRAAVNPQLRHASPSFARPPRQQRAAPRRKRPRSCGRRSCRRSKATRWPSQARQRSGDRFEIGCPKMTVSSNGGRPPNGGKWNIRSWIGGFLIVMGVPPKMVENGKSPSIYGWSRGTPHFRKPPSMEDLWDLLAEEWWFCWKCGSESKRSPAVIGQINGWQFFYKGSEPPHMM